MLDADGKLLEDPVHYRDERTKDWPQRVAQKIELHSLYVRTGNQILAINTLFQLLALQEEQPDLLRRAKHLLFIPDLLAAMLGAPTVVEVGVEPEKKAEQESLNLESQYRHMLEKALEKNGGNRRKAAQELGISERTLFRRIKQYGLDV